MKLSQLHVLNYRGLRNVSIPLSSFVCITGENNGGKSSILQSLSLFLSGSALKATDYFDTSLTITIAVTLSDVTPEDLTLLADEHRDRIAALVVDKTLTLVRLYGTDGKSQLGYYGLVPKEARYSSENVAALVAGKKGGQLKDAVLAVFPELAGQVNASTTQGAVKDFVLKLGDALPAADKTTQFIPLPTGLDKSVIPMLPERIYIPAVKDLADDTKTAETSSFGKILAIVMKAIEPLLADEKDLFEKLAAIVDVVAPQPGQAICDAACGTGGFLLASHDYIAKHHALDRAQKKKLKCGTLFGIELVDSVARLCCMNLLLHGIGESGTGSQPVGKRADSQDGRSTLEDEVPVLVKDALAGKHGEYDLVLANPPFGKRSSVTIVNEAGETSKESLIINRDDFWASTSNKQLNFLQHIFTILKQHGRAAVVLPDNVLFEGGAGETIRRALLKQADVHTLLRLPTGIFYAKGVKANVLFFDRKPAQEKPWTQKLWIYDLRTNMHFTLKENTLKRTDLDDFVECYNLKNRHERKPTWSEKNEKGRWRAFAYDDLVKRDKVNLDIFWLKDEVLEESANLPAPENIAQEITDDLEAALEQFATIAEDLKK